MDAYITRTQIVDGEIYSINVGVGLYDIQFCVSGAVCPRKRVRTPGGHSTTWRLMKRLPADVLAAAEAAARQHALEA